MKNLANLKRRLEGVLKVRGMVECIEDVETIVTDAKTLIADF
jgi:hypothetical protein